MYTAQNNLNQFSLKSYFPLNQTINTIYKHPSMNVSTFTNNDLETMHTDNSTSKPTEFLVVFQSSFFCSWDL